MGEHFSRRARQDIHRSKFNVIETTGHRTEQSNCADVKRVVVEELQGCETWTASTARSIQIQEDCKRERLIYENLLHQPLEGGRRSGLKPKCIQHIGWSLSDMVEDLGISSLKCCLESSAV